MPATVTLDLLGLHCIFSDGSEYRRALRVRRPVEVPGLARTLLEGATDLVHPHGQVDSRGGIDLYFTALRGFTDWLAEFGFTGEASDLTRPLLARYWRQGVRSSQESALRAMLRCADDQMQILAPDVRAFVDGRLFNTGEKYGSHQPYSEAEWARLIDTCRDEVDAAYRTFRTARDRAAAADGPGAIWRDRVAHHWLVLHQGPDPLVHEMLTVGNFPFRQKYGVGLRAVVDPLIPNLDVIIAYRLLFGAYTGVVPDGITDLGLDDIEWAGDEKILLSYVKGRTAAESLALSRQATRLLEQWLDHSAVARRFAPEALRNELWVRFTPGGTDAGERWLAKPATRLSIRAWVDRRQAVDEQGRPLRMTGDDGLPLVPHMHRIRTAHDALQERSHWRGSRRTTVDPNRTPGVEGDHYLTNTTPAQLTAVEDIIAQAQEDLVRRAQPPLVLATTELSDLVSKYPEHMERLGLDDDALAQLLSGERDVFTAACGDQLSGLHGPKGKPCPARPWVCLLCPLAVFAPRHLPNLLRLRAFFSRQWQQMTTAEFMPVFGPYAHRLDELLAPDRYFSERALREAATEITDSDVELPLRPEELTA
ncbi:hypothetical protein [Streptomyces scabiei]|uniref:hypothetical protein n=1 Tax=Streptomyces scabiei TaxID=1930 RepID=UPI001B33DB95|nr:hypothetical protein [Streptomyces sp. LBUM 1488]MBP5898058.1 hypothetical protein [Streptomyces sp. LBUM 1488]